MPFDDEHVVQLGPDVCLLVTDAFGCRKRPLLSLSLLVRFTIAFLFETCPPLSQFYASKNSFKLNVKELAIVNNSVVNTEWLVTYLLVSRLPLFSFLIYMRNQ